MEAEDVARVVAPWVAGLGERVQACEERVRACEERVQVGLANEAEAYRLHVLTEAARLRVTHKELSKARALADGDDIGREEVGT